MSSPYHNPRAHPLVELGQEPMALLSDNAIHVKWNHHGTLRRFQLAEQDWKFPRLMEKIRLVEPRFNEALCYADGDGDKILFSSSVEMDEMRMHFRHLRVNTIKIESIEKPIETGTPPPVIEAVVPRPTEAETDPPRLERFGPTAGEEPMDAQAPPPTALIHPNVLCDSCNEGIRGIRYKCITCDDYDLCQVCERTGTHGEHPMVRLATPATPKPYELFFYGRGGHRGHHHRHHHLNRDQRRVLRGLQRLDAAMPPVPQPPFPRPERPPAPPTGPFTPETCRQLAGRMAESRARMARLITERRQNIAGRVELPAQPTAPAQEEAGQQRGEEAGGSRRSFHERLGYLKDIGAQVQQALLNFGIECEATVEDGTGRVHGRLPFSSVGAKRKHEHEQSTEAVPPKQQQQSPPEQQPQQQQQGQAGNPQYQQQTSVDEVAEKVVNAIQQVTAETIQKATQVAMGAMSAATEIVNSLDRDFVGEYASQAAQVNQLLETGKSGMETFAQNLNPLVEELKKCTIATPMPAPANPTANATAPVQVVSELARSGEMPAEQLYPTLERAVGEMSVVSSSPQPPAAPPASPPSESVIVEIDPDSDVEIVNDVEAVEKEASAVLGGDEEFVIPRMEPVISSVSSSSSSSSCSSVADDGDFVLVSKSSYKQLCDFYSKQRKQGDGESQAEQATADSNTDEAMNTPMSYEEKKVLSAAINNLPGACLSEVVDLICRMENREDSAEELEIDFEVLKPTTLRTLEALVKEMSSRQGPSSSSSAAPPSQRHQQKKVLTSELLAVLKEKSQAAPTEFNETIRADYAATVGGGYACGAEAEGIRVYPSSETATAPPASGIEQQVPVPQPQQQQSGQSGSGNGLLYPQLVAEQLRGEEKCYAGFPFNAAYRPTQSMLLAAGGKHSRTCLVRHPDENIQSTVDTLVALGYDNCNGWLTGLSEQYGGVLDAVLEAVEQDTLYKARQAD